MLLSNTPQYTKAIEFVKVSVLGLTSCAARDSEIADRIECGMRNKTVSNFGFWLVLTFEFVLVLVLVPRPRKSLFPEMLFSTLSSIEMNLEKI
jgi:hypothetical protein